MKSLLILRDLWNDLDSKTVLKFLPRMLNLPPGFNRRGPSPLSSRAFTCPFWVSTLDPRGGWGPTVGETEAHLPRNSHNSSTRSASAAAAPASCLGEGTSRSLSAGHRTRKKMLCLQGREQLGRLCPWSMASPRSPVGCSKGPRFK